jgi:hypothetical protein
MLELIRYRSVNPVFYIRYMGWFRILGMKWKMRHTQCTALKLISSRTDYE